MNDFRKFRSACLGVAAASCRSTSRSRPLQIIRMFSEHEEWFRKRPDGTIQYAENPPKKYQDIYPFDFETAYGSNSGRN